MSRLNNSDIADIFDKVANLLEIKGETFFRVKAYRNLARILNELPKDVTKMVTDQEDLTQIPGIGKDLATKITTIVISGKLPLLEELQQQLPPSLLDLLNLQGLGPKKIKILYEQLNITNFTELKAAAEQHKIHTIPGFGKKTEQIILDGLEKVQSYTFRLLINRAEQIAESLKEYLTNLAEVDSVTLVGSCRRKKETIGDIDILITTDTQDINIIIDRFITYPDIETVLAQGETKVSVVLTSRIQVDLRIIPKESYGAALQYFTGSKEHNVEVRKLAHKKGLKINEYGVYKNDQKIAGTTEKEVYATIGLDYIEPELRENQGEIEAAIDHTLPKLITLSAIKGDLHSHTNNSDGLYSLEQMVNAAKALGYEYIAITDHSKHVTIAHGLDDKRMFSLLKEIDDLQNKINGITILKSAEVDILEDGTLDFSDNVLKELDLVVGAIHYKFNLSRQKQTERIIRAMDNKYFRILAHPTGRLLNEREPYDIDMEAIMQAAKVRQRILEINSHPHRLDLNDVHCKMAKSFGVKIAISTDAHGINDLYFMRYGINQARRGWLTNNDVINTYSLHNLKKILNI